MLHNPEGDEESGGVGLNTVIARTLYSELVYPEPVEVW